MEIGDPEKTFVIEPAEDPFETPAPAEPEPERAPATPEKEPVRVPA